jgi:hypothetical protein
MTAAIAAAPELAAAAEGGAGAAKAGSAGATRAPKRAPKKGAPKGTGRRQITQSMSTEDVQAELQARRQQAAAGKGDKADDSTPATDPDSGTASSKAAPLFTADRMSVSHTGGGFVLGVLGWALFVNYMHGGVPQVKQLLRAKFLNQTGAVSR